MKAFKLTAAICLTIGSVASVPVTALPAGTSALDSHYFVRPAVRVGSGGVQDGLRINGATVASQSQGVSGTSRSEVNLRDGTVKMYAEEGGSSAVGLQTFGSFGERLTLRNGAGTYLDMNFGIEGSIFGELGPLTPGVTPATFVYNVGMVVFDAGIANWSNFVALATDQCWGQDPLNCTPVAAPRVSKLTQRVYSPPVHDWDPVDDYYNYFDTDVFASINGRVLLESNNEQLDIFLYTNVYHEFGTAGVGSGVEEYILDFENTATYSQNTALGVEVFSSSGEFLGLGAPPPIDPPVIDPPSAVPEPATLPLLVFGLLSLLMFSRRNKSV